MRAFLNAFPGDCPECGAALVVTRVTGEPGRPAYAVMCPTPPPGCRYLPESVGQICKRRYIALMGS